jgi:hypothetical protein
MYRTVLILVAALLVAAAGAAVWFFMRPAESVSASSSPGDSRSMKGVSLAPESPSPSPLVKLPANIQIRFREVTREAGLDFQHFDGRTDMEYIMDQTGSGLAWLDYDRDGLMDLFLVQGYTFVPPYPATAPTCKLYKNLGGGKFRDVTAEVGLVHVGCGQGVAVGDIDNSGYPSIFLTCFGKPNVLYRNVSDGKGGRTFKDITAQAGMLNHPDWRDRPNFSTSAAFLDYNNDGYLDLFVCSYVKIDMEHYPDCRAPDGRRGPCPPSKFEPTHCVLYRNNGDGTFTDVSVEAGITKVAGKALGVVALNLNDENDRILTDLFVANDTENNFLFRNLGNGKFEETAILSGCAVSGAGNKQAYMGVDADPLTDSGRPDIFSTAFQHEPSSLFRNDGGFFFQDVVQGSGLGPPCWNHLKFGTCFLDVDRDGSLDIVVANGHVSRNVDQDGDPKNTFRQEAQLFLNNDGKGHFQEISTQAGPYFLEKHVGRGLACCDYDNDGHMDLAFNNSGEPAVLLHNESKTPYHWIRLELVGSRHVNPKGSNRDAIGAKVTVHVANRKIVRHRKGGGSYCSASDPRLLIGIGAAAKVDKIEIHWPSGVKQQIGPLDADRGYRVTEGADKVETRP